MKNYEYSKKSNVKFIAFIILFVLAILIIIISTLSFVSGVNISLISTAIIDSHNPLDMDGCCFFRSSRDLGESTRVIQACDLLVGWFSQARGVCRGAYAVKNNKLDICLALDDNDTTQEPACLTEFAVKNRDVNLCDKLEGYGRDYNRGNCRSEVFRFFQINNTFGYEFQPGVVNDINVKDNSFTLEIDVPDVDNPKISLYKTVKIFSRGGKEIRFSEIKNGHYVRVYGGNYTKLDGQNVDVNIFTAFIIFDDSIN